MVQLLTKVVHFHLDGVRRRHHTRRAHGSPVRADRWSHTPSSRWHRHGWAHHPGVLWATRPGSHGRHARRLTSRHGSVVTHGHSWVHADARHGHAETGAGATRGAWGHWTTRGEGAGILSWWAHRQPGARVHASRIGRPSARRVGARPRRTGHLTAAWGARRKRERSL